jgi:signal transduction histidine kinase
MVLSVLVLAAGVGTAWYVQRLLRTEADILASNMGSMRAAAELHTGLHKLSDLLEQYTLTGDRTSLATLPCLRQDTDYWLAEADRLGDTPPEQVLMERVKKGYARFFAELDRILQEPSGGTARQKELRQLLDDVLTGEILAPAHEYLKLNEEMAAQATAQNQLTARWMVVGWLALGICGPAAGLLAGFGIARRLNRSIVRLSLPIRDAAGRLNEVVGPVTLAPGWNLEELEGVLYRLAEQIGSVIERLQQSQREALRAEQLATLGQLAAGMAHELRNPLMSMKILVQSAADQSEPAGLGGRDLGVLEEEIIRLERLTRTFLDFAKPPKLEKRTIEARATLEQVVGLVSSRASRQGVHLDCHLPKSPVVLNADAGQIRQLLLNLLLNALDAVTDGGMVQVHLELAEATRALAAPSSQSLTIRVADTGQGLPDDPDVDIFAPFVSTKQAGVGLGLSICKRIVEAHGGEITAANRLHGGAVFTVRLPCLKGHEAVSSCGDNHGKPAGHR